MLGLRPSLRKQELISNVLRPTRNFQQESESEKRERQIMEIKEKFGLLATTSEASGDEWNDLKNK